ncbi:MAG: DNA glycosylase, partial [Candidatus Nitrosotenuis sp.]
MQINLDHTINSGQVFLWEKFDSVWYGINGNDVLSVDEKNPKLVSSFLKSDYDLFRDNDNWSSVIKSISKDKTIKEATRKFSG